MITYGSTTLTSYNTITKIEVYYYKSTSPTSLSGGSWSTTKPTWENGKYIWQKIRTTYEGKLENGQYYSESDPVNITGQQGQQGVAGTSAYSYKLTASDTIVTISKTGVYSTNSVTFSATSKQGTDNVTEYSGRFKIETTSDGITWTTRYPASGTGVDESSTTFTIPANISNIRCSLYQTGGMTVLLDIISVSIVQDGTDGIDGTSENLLMDVYVPSLTRVKAPWNRYISNASNSTITGEFIEEANLPDPNATHFFRFTDSSATTYGRGLCFYTNGTPPFVNGHTYKIGCWVRKHAGEPKITVILGSMSGSFQKKIITNTDWEWIEWVRTFGETDSTIDAHSSSYKKLYFYFYNNNVEGSSLDMCGFRLENVQTDISTARNLLFKTEKLIDWETTNGVTISDGIATIPEVTTNTIRGLYPTKNFKYELIRNQTAIFSIRVKAEAGKICGCNLCFRLTSAEDSIAAQKFSNNYVHFTGTGNWQTICIATPINDEFFASGDGTVDYDNCWATVKIESLGTYHNGFQVKEPQFSLGTTATAWSPAPEDVNENIQQVQDNLDNLEIGGRNLLPFKDCLSSISLPVTNQGITLIKEEDGWIRVSGTRISSTSGSSFPLWINPTGNNYNAPISDNVPQDGNEDNYTLSLEIEGTPFIIGDSYTTSTHVVAYGNTSGVSVRIGGINGLKDTRVFPTYMSVVRYYIGVNCEGSVDGRFRVKLEKGGKATNWTPAPEDVSADIQQVQDNLDNLEIGGRNLIIGTLNPIATGGTGIYRPHIFGQITNTSGRGACTVAEHGLRFTNTTANWEYIYFGSPADTTQPCMLGLEAGQTYTLSADLSWKILSSDTGKANTTTYGIGALLAYSSEANPNDFVTAVSNYPLLITQADKGTDMSGRLVFTFTVPSDAIRLYLGIRANITKASHYAIGDYLEARNLKLEKGSKATDWTPAPEDVETEITSLEENLKSQIDEKIQTFYQATNPAESWSVDERSAHDGDLWYYTGNTTTTYTKDNVYRYNASNNTWTVYSASGELFDKIDGKTTIYYGTTSGTYTDVKIGDYLVDSTDGSSYRYDGSNWIKVTDYKTGIDAAQASADTANDKIDNLEIGGRNLLLDTATERISPASSNNSAYVAPTPTMSDYGSSILNNRNDYFTYSFDYEVTGNEAPEAYIYVQIRGGTVPTASDGYYSYVLENPTGKHCCTFKLTEAQATGTSTGCGIRLRYATDGAILRVWNIKLEKGTKATDWTPAPEDVQAEAEKAKKTATNYMSSDNTGIMVADLKDGEQLPANATGKNVFITAGYESGSTAVDAGVHIRDGQTDLASFGETARIGKKTRGNVYIDNDSVDINNDETTYASFGQTTTIGTDCKVSMTGNVFSMSNPKGYDMFRFTTSNTHDGNAYVSTRYTTDGTTTVFFSNYTISFIRDCYYEDNVDTKIPFPSIDSEDNTKVTFDSPPSKTFIIAYATMDNLYQATLGTRYSGDTPEHGAFGSRSIAIGNSNNGYGRESIAIGSRNNLNTNFCMGLGYYLNVGEYDRTEGVSAKSAQVVIGRYNEQKPNIDYSFIIGNGTSNTARHNAFAITTSNEIQISLDTTASSGTTDARLYDAITALGWQNDVIE